MDFPQSSHADASYTQTADCHLHIRQMHPISPQAADFSSKSDLYSAAKEAADDTQVPIKTTLFRLLSLLLMTH